MGGKTGLNHARGKNLIGVFHQPRVVLADVEVLRTLGRRELVAGIAEVIKTGAIGDPALFHCVESRLEDLLALEESIVIDVVAACVRYKARIVGDDEREEHGGRAVLNFGHTVDHAIEALTDYLLALRALLEPEGPSSGRLAQRLAVICARPEDRAALAERTARAISLERAVITGLAAAGPGPDALVDELAENLRAILRDALCGHLGTDLCAVADELLAQGASAPAVQETAI